MTKNSPHPRGLVWIRRDLRLRDHKALAQASQECEGIAVVFVFDPIILKRLKASDRRLSFLHESLTELDSELREKGSRLLVRHGDPKIEIPRLAKQLGAQKVFANKDYEPYAKARDSHVQRTLRAEGIEFESFKDQVIFESREVLTKSDGTFRVFTPYKNAWLEKLRSSDLEEAKVQRNAFLPASALKGLVQDFSLSELGFQKTELWLKAGETAALARLKRFQNKIDDYKKARDFPSVDGTSGLSVHLRFGTISTRACAREALLHKSEGASTWLNELIWRDFYHMILDQNPYVAEGSFKKECDRIHWPGSMDHFEAWCEGRTGYPIVDAAMRHFNETGWMHNRLRMIVASFLTKDLLVDWRLGEAYFAENLLDFDLAANNGGWQWSASTGCDAQPYFRIFNPSSQSEKFDPEGKFIRTQIPELKNEKNIHAPEADSLFSKYPAPIVSHSAQRAKALALFKDLK